MGSIYLYHAFSIADVDCFSNLFAFKNDFNYKTEKKEAQNCIFLENEEFIIRIGTGISYQWPNYQSRLRTLLEREWWPSWGQTNIACFLLWVNQNQVFTTKSFFWIYILLDYNSTVDIAAYSIPSFSKLNSFDFWP